MRPTLRLTVRLDGFLGGPPCAPGEKAKQSLFPAAQRCVSPFPTPAPLSRPTTQPVAFPSPHITIVAPYVETCWMSFLCDLSTQRNKYLQCVARSLALPLSRARQNENEAPYCSALAPLSELHEQQAAATVPDTVPGSQSVTCSRSRKSDTSCCDIVCGLTSLWVEGPPPADVNCGTARKLSHLVQLACCVLAFRTK